MWCGGEDVMGYVVVVYCINSGGDSNGDLLL